MTQAALNDDISLQKIKASQWFESLRDEIVQAFEAIEVAYCKAHPEKEPGRFEKKAWPHPQGGGGTMAVMRGQVFEKVGVNISTVWGEFSPEFRKEIPGAEEDPTFWASGISLVAHMRSPLVPAVHMNTRHIVTTKSWFGGGSDLTPMYPQAQETQRFHQAFQEACDRHDPSYYPKFKDWCDRYFYLPHRQEPRGIGGIFYDYINSGSWEADFAFTKDIGRTFKEIYCDLVRDKMYLPWTDEQRAHQLQKRGRYVEFNLLYDRGTLFGLKTQGNPEAILMSLPPEVTW